jgi:hypothetical protein
MTDRIKGPGRSPFDNSRVMKWKNVSGESVPAYGVVKLSSYVEDDDYFEAVKPDGKGSLHFVNGPVAVANDAFGGSQMWDISRIGKTSGAFGEVVGPVDGSWEMTTEGTGFVVFSTPDDYAGTAALLKDGGGGGGGGHTIWFTITDVLCPETDYVSETTLVATATWYNLSCTGTPPGAEYGGDYYVYDICNYLYGLTPQDLVGTTGRATYHYPLTGYCEPRWIIDDLCAQPECD